MATELVTRTEDAAETNTDNHKYVVVVFNPVSGQGDPEERKRLIGEALAEHGYQCQHLVTTKERGARMVAEAALADKPNLLAVSGGDGTVVEVMTALIGSGVPLAIFPAGTGNLLAVNLDLPKEMPHAVHAALFGSRHAIDLAHLTHRTVNGEPEERYFAIVAGVGFDAHIMRDADRESKKRFGLGAYLWAALRHLRHRPMRATIYLDDKARPLRRRAKSVMVANMGRLQGGVEMVPDVDPSDGSLVVTLVKAETLGAWARVAWNAIRHHLRDDPSVEYHSCHKVRVELSPPQPMQYDGEATEARCQWFTASVVPHAVEVMVPC